MICKNINESDTTFEKTVKWYKSYYENDKVFLTAQDLESYVADAKEKNIEWSL
jgi:CDP-glucose 4,6-dehydratase